MAESVLYVDGFDTSSLGFQVEGVANWRSGLEANWPSVEIPGRYGVLVTGVDPIYRPRELTINGAILADDLASMLSNLDTLKWRIGRSEKYFTLVDSQHGRRFWGRATRFRATGIQPMMVQVGTRLAITVWMPDPRIYDASQQNITGIGASATDLPMGTAPVRATVGVTGAGTFTLRYRDDLATIVGTMTITGATSPVTIDMDAQTIVDGSGNAVDKLTAGDFFEFSPDDGSYQSSSWPTLEVTAGTASANYYKAYL